MTCYEQYMGTDIIKAFLSPFGDLKENPSQKDGFVLLKCSVNPADRASGAEIRDLIELKSKEMIDSCIKLIKVYKLHDGRTRPLRKIQDIYIDLKYIIKNKNKESPSLKNINNFCDRIRELNEHVQEEIINIINKYNKILEEMIEDPRLFLENNKLTSNSKKTSKMTCPLCNKEVFIYSYETSHKGSKKCEYYQTHKIKRQPNDKIKCCDKCDYTQSYSNSSRMNKHRLLCEAYCEAYLLCLINESIKEHNS